MGSLRALSIAGVIAVSTIGSATAADLLPPPPVIVTPVEPVDVGGTWYIRGDIGVGINEISNLRSSLDSKNLLGGPPPPTQVMHKNIGDSGIIGAGVGYQFNNWFRGDITGEYRSEARYRSGVGYAGSYLASGNPPHYLNYCGGAFCMDSYDASVHSAVFMANGYVDLGTWYGMTPYIGGGIGFAHHRLSALTDIGGGGASGYAPDRHHTNFAWNVGAGVSFNVTQNVKMDFGYRYTDMGTIRSNAIVCGDVNSCFNERHRFDLAAHDFRLGFRYMFGDPPPVPVAVPLVRKY